MIKFDLTSAYHFIEIYKPHTKYFGFSWKNKNGAISLYKFLVLPFGLSSACSIFTKLTRPLISKWQSEGKLVVMFLDDGLGCAFNFEKTKEIVLCIKNDLLLSGLVPNATKCNWVPVQIIEFLGVSIDSRNRSIYIPERRLDKALETISAIINANKVHRRVHVWQLTSFVGQIISMSVVLGNISQIMTRYLSIDISCAVSCDSFIKLSSDSLQQIYFWQENLGSLNKADMFDINIYSKKVFSDASRTGFADYEIRTERGVSHGQWTVEESFKSSTWRELVAVFRVMQSLSHYLSGHRVKWFSDNQSIISIVKKGSMNEELQCVALDIFRFCLRKSIVLYLEWVWRTRIEKADYLSKILEYDDWGISFGLFNGLQNRFGIFEVDWFASEYNAKVSVFYSRFWNPTSSGIDAFTEKWTEKFGIFVPPISMVYRVLQKMELDRAKGVLVVPLWNSAVFWPILCPNGNFIPNVKDWIDLPTKKEFYVSSLTGKGIFGNIDLQFRMLVLSIDFKGE